MKLREHFYSSQGPYVEPVYNVSSLLFYTIRKEENFYISLVGNLFGPPPYETIPIIDNRHQLFYSGFSFLYVSSHH